MSEETEVKTTEESEVNVLDSLKSFLEDLVPPSTTVIADVFGNEYELISSISARKQIKILREFDKIEEIKGVEFKDEDNILQTIVKVASNEDYLNILCRCFSMAHGKVLQSAKESADKESYEYEDGEFMPADLFSLEELAAAIIPLFIRLAKRTSQAIDKIMPK